MITPARPDGRPVRNRIEERVKGLLQLSLNGDVVAYTAFLEIMSGYLRGMLKHRLRSFEDDVEDVLQEVLFAMHNGLHTYRDQVPFTAWVAAIVRHKVSDFLRGHARREALHDPFDEETELFASSEAQTVEARRDIDKLLERLPERQRASIEHVRLEGLSVAETAKLTGLSEAVVKVGIHRGIKALSRHIRGGTT